MEEVKTISEDVSVKTLIDVPEDPVDAHRMQRVKEAMIHAWSSYEKYAWGQDELQVHFSFHLYKPNLVSFLKLYS